MKYIYITLALCLLAFPALAQIDRIDTGLSDVVSDTTPQLGGDLDANGNTITGLAADGQVLFNSSGNIIGEAGFEYDEDTNTLDVGHIETDIATKTDSFTWALTDSDYLRFNSTGSMTGTVPPNASVAFPTGTIRCFEIFDGANTGTIVAGSGVTVNTNTSLVYTSAAGCLVKVDTNQWTAVGGD